LQVGVNQHVSMHQIDHFYQKDQNFLWRRTQRLLSLTA